MDECPELTVAPFINHLSVINDHAHQLLSDKQELQFWRGGAPVSYHFGTIKNEISEGVCVFLWGRKGSGGTS